MDRNTEKKLDQILSELIEGWKGWAHDQLDGTTSLEEELSDINSAKRKAKREIKKLLSRSE